MAEQPFNFPVFALVQGHCQPTVGALNPVERDLRRPVTDVVYSNSFRNIRYDRIIDLSMRADPVRSSYSLRRMFQIARQCAVIGEQQQAFAVDVQSSY